jgi:chromosome segregation ATPase
MEFNNEEDLENNKEMEENNPNKKKITFMLLPKKDYRVDKEKYSFNNDDFNEKKFYKTSGKGFSFGRGNKKAFTNFDNKNENNYNQKRIRSSTIDKKNLHNSNRIQNVYFNNKENDANMIKMLQKRINEIEKELENNENTFVYNQKIMQKKIDEKEQTIKILNKKLEDVTENNKKNVETNMNNLKKNYIIKIKDLSKENNKLKLRNDELMNKIEENEEIIKGLEEKNKLLVEQINEVNQKYNIFIMNDEKKIFEDDIKELIKRYDDKLIEDQNELNSLNEELHYLNQENKRLKTLTKEIIEARNETEIFFLDALNEVKKDLYKLKKEKDKRGSFFPTLKKNYEINTVKVDIRALTPEMRERILRNLFEKINKGYEESKFRELNNIMAADISDDEGGY